MKPDYETAFALALALVDATLERTWACGHCGYVEVITDHEQTQRRKAEHEDQCPSHTDRCSRAPDKCCGLPAGVISAHELLSGG